MSEFGGLWQHPNNPAWTKNAKSLQKIEVGHHTEAEEPPPSWQVGENSKW